VKRTRLLKIERGPLSYTQAGMRGRLAIFMAVLTVGLLSVGLLSTDALAESQQDASSTHTALLAAYTTLNAVVNSWPTVEASLHNVEHKFATECPNIGAGSPQSEPEQRLSYEVAGALFAAGYHADAKIAETFIKTVSPLKWSNPSLTRRAHQFIKGLREMIALQVPNICGDVRSWTATGYATIPASTLQFDQHVEAINVEVPSPQILARYIQPADLGLFAKVQRLLKRFEELEFTTGQQAWDSLLETLGLQQ
jgi:hypothetical protein